MILRADYLQNRFFRAMANRQILKNISVEVPKKGKKRALINSRLRENYRELRNIEFFKVITNLKP